MNNRYLILSVLSIFLIVTFSSCDKENIFEGDIHEEKDVFHEIDIIYGDLKGKKWFLTELKHLSESKEPKGEVDIEFKDSGIEGRGGCNHYWVERYKLEKNIFEVGFISGTLVGCGKEKNNFERLYFHVLKYSKRIKLEDNELIIISDKGELHYSYLE